MESAAVAMSSEAPEEVPVAEAPSNGKEVMSVVPVPTTIATVPVTPGPLAPAAPGAASSPGGIKKKGRGGGSGPGSPEGGAGSPILETVEAVEAGTAPPAGNPLALRHERCSGTISKYVPSSGCGFVKSHLFEGELSFKTEGIMVECQNYNYQEGEVVEFDVQSDERGRPQAVALKPMVGRKPHDCLGQRHRGYVRRFADRWGFLNAAAFDGDLFVHRDNLLMMPEQLQDGQPPLRAGQAVEFDIAQDDRGRTVAKQITTSALLRPCDWIGRRLQGYIRSFQGAWGFINSDRFAGDLFVHRDSLLPHCQSLELNVGCMVEFDVERDHHKKGGKNRLVARQVDVLNQPNAAAQAAAASYAAQMPPQAMLPQGMGGQMPGMDPMLYGTVPPGQPLPGPYGPLNPNAASFAPLQPAPMYYQGTQPMLDPGLGQLGYGQSPYPYPDPQQYAQTMPPPQLLPPMQGQVMPPPQYGQPLGTLAPPGSQPQPQYAQPPMPQPPLPQAQLPQATLPPPQMAQPHLAQPQFGQPYGQPQYGQLPYGQPLGTGPPQQPMAQPQALPTPEGAAAQTAMSPMPGLAAEPPPMPTADGQAAPASSPSEPSVLLHITTHDWEPDQPGQLRVRKGTLVNVSHRAAHGWVYAATVQQGGESSEPSSEGWVPQAVAKRVSLCRVAVDWPAEGSGTLGLIRGDLIAVSKEAERGWVYGERVSPQRPDWAADGWLPKKVLEYLLV
mmetsp:Transcript_12272/g.25924  ORF Transcript_12272/g.25924 Transcript_12272/m.25924 type:complete len:726 (-) Transcript_12272:66-2243(-)